MEKTPPPPSAPASAAPHLVQPRRTPNGEGAPVAQLPQPSHTRRNASDTAAQAFEASKTPSASKVWLSCVNFFCCTCIACADTFQECSQDCRSNCMFLRKILRSSRFLYLMAVLCFFMSIFVLFVGGTISSVYWDEDYLPIEEALEKNATTLNGTAGAAAKDALAQWRKKPLLKYFPMGQVHVWPAVIVALGFVPFCCYFPRPADGSSVGYYYEDDTNRLNTLACGVDFGLSLCSFVFVFSGSVFAGVLSVAIMTAKFRDKAFPFVGMVPTISCDAAVFFMVMSVTTLYVASWKAVVESRTPNEDNATSWRIE